VIPENIHTLPPAALVSKPLPSESSKTLSLSLFPKFKTVHAPSVPLQFHNHSNSPLKFLLFLSLH